MDVAAAALAEQVVMRRRERGSAVTRSSPRRAPLQLDPDLATIDDDGTGFVAVRPAVKRGRGGYDHDRDVSVLTVGHSTHSLERLVGLLRAAGVEAVADVRRHPGSRRMPWFGSEALRAGLEQAGIAYEHLPELGGRRSRAAGSPNGAWRVRAFQGYADHMATPEFAAGIERLKRLAGARRTALMCAEANWWQCHRRLVADALLARGLHVEHLARDGRLVVHELPEFARVQGTRVEYPQRASP